MTEPTKETRCGDCKHWSQVSKYNSDPIGLCIWSPPVPAPSWLGGDRHKFASDVTPCEAFEAEEGGETA